MERGCERQVAVRATAGACAPACSLVGRDRGDVPLHGGVDRRAVLRREQVEQQAARDRDAEARLGPGLGLVAALRDRDPRQRLDPQVDDAVEDRQGVGVALERLRVDLEEQALVRPERRVGDAAATRGASISAGVASSSSSSVASAARCWASTVRMTSISRPSRDPKW